MSDSQPAATGALDLDAVEARVNAAAPGPWVDRDGQLLVNPDTNDIDYVLSCCNMDDQTLSFIAHAREDVPRLLALARQGAALREALSALGDTGWESVYEMRAYVRDRLDVLDGAP